VDERIASATFLLYNCYWQKRKSHRAFNSARWLFKTK